MTLVLRFAIVLSEKEFYVDVVVVIVVALRDDKTIDFKLGNYISRGKEDELSRQKDTWVSPFHLQNRM